MDLLEHDFREGPEKSQWCTTWHATLEASCPLVRSFGAVWPRAEIAKTEPAVLPHLLGRSEMRRGLQLSSVGLH